MQSPQSFGSWVKTVRLALGLTQDEFARLVYCAPITVRKIEHDRLRPSHQLAASILDKVGVPPEEREPLIELARVRPAPMFTGTVGQSGSYFGQGE